MDFSFLEKINNNGIYLTTKKRLKAIFADANQMKVWFTRHPRHRRFKPEPPIIKGNRVVATVFYSRDRVVYMGLYPLSKEENLEKAVEDFNNVVALEIKQWIDEQIKKPNTALVSNERLVVEWNGHKNIIHKVR